MTTGGNSIRRYRSDRSVEFRAALLLAGALGLTQLGAACQAVRAAASETNRDTRERYGDANPSMAALDREVCCCDGPGECSKERPSPDGECPSDCRLISDAQVCCTPESGSSAGGYQSDNEVDGPELEQDREDDRDGDPYGGSASSGKPRPARTRSGGQCKRDDAVACRSECDAGDTSSCVRLGSMYVNGRGVPQNLKRAFSYRARACKAKDGEGCYFVAVMLHKGQGVTKNAGAACAGYEMACSLSMDLGCLDAGIMYATGDGVSKDHEKARRLFERSCKRREPMSCQWLKRLDSADLPYD